VRGPESVHSVESSGPELSWPCGWIARGPRQARGARGRRLYCTMLRCVSALALVMLYAHGAAAAPAHRLATQCALDSVGVPLSKATRSGDVILGEAWGETFYTDNTLLESVTVWRLIPNDYTPMTFWLTSADSLNPAIARLHEGPTIVVYNPDSTTIQPTPIQYTFDPPLPLPGAGLYTIWVQCACAGDLYLMIDTNNDNPAGQLWQSDRSNFSGCVLAGANGFPTADLCFSAVFCRNGTVPTICSTWGQLKAKYR
jgi:hypothetical protein